MATFSSSMLLLKQYNLRVATCFSFSYPVLHSISGGKWHGHYKKSLFFTSRNHSQYYILPTIQTKKSEKYHQDQTTKKGGNLLLFSISTIFCHAIQGLLDRCLVKRGGIQQQFVSSLIFQLRTKLSQSDMALLLQYVPDTYPLMVLDGKGDAYMNTGNFHGGNCRAIMVFTSEIRFPEGPQRIRSMKAFKSHKITSSKKSKHHYGSVALI